jgi:hypothetical protein
VANGGVVLRFLFRLRGALRHTQSRNTTSNNRCSQIHTISPFLERFYRRGQDRNLKLEDNGTPACSGLSQVNFPRAKIKGR